MPDYDKRLKEFVWYHIHGDGDCNGQVLRAYAEKEGLSLQDCFDLTYFYATTYCCASAIFLLQNRERIMKNYQAFADEYKQKLVFQSDRKYVRMLDNFKGMLATWVFQLSDCALKFGEIFVDHGVVNMKKLLSYCQSRGVMVVYGEYNPPTWEMKGSQEWVSITIKQAVTRKKSNQISRCLIGYNSLL